MMQLMNCNTDGLRTFLLSRAVGTTPHRRPPGARHLHSGDEMQDQVLGGQAVSQKRMREEPKQLCADGRQFRHET